MKIAILFLGLFGLFGQFFNGVIIPGVLVASVSAVAVALLGFVPTKKIVLIKWITIFLFVVTILGSAYDIFDYYSQPQFPGNYYGAWFWSVPLCICLAIYIKQLSDLCAGQRKP